MVEDNKELRMLEKILRGTGQNCGKSSSFSSSLMEQTVYCNCLF